jgi:ketosteroid isomerase-like protein
MPNAFSQCRLLTLAYKYAFMINNITLLLLLAIAGTSKAQSTKQDAIKAINNAEKAFKDMAAEKGIREAFVYFAADNAIIKRGNDSLVYGRAGIGNFYSGEFFKQATVSWSPDVTDAAASGDMGYTIGKYEWIVKDSSGNIKNKSTGIFHTVWKKQADGSWKYVWD